MRKIKEKLFKYYVLIAVVLILISLCALFSTKDYGKFSVSLIGVLAGSIYFMQKHRLEETKLFKELFTEFNKRYDDLNNDLIKIINKTDDQSLEEAGKIIIIDYFNLCAEEYFFFKHGYIPCEVWDDWHNGIKEKLKSNKIKMLWQQEKGTNSYYGLDKYL